MSWGFPAAGGHWGSEYEGGSTPKKPKWPKVLILLALLVALLVVWVAF